MKEYTKLKFYFNKVEIIQENTRIILTKKFIDEVKLNWEYADDSNFKFPLI